ncbi:MAG: response regulator transcription factor [Clostridia bacterium]|nr:response regulator transcription factor [Clostridia bacterium]MBQ4543430.1 response regulator transcription factor [Clostridia bacterium]MBQ9997988.1 response regulator transcription factor [Clostridia bacterium]
MRILVVDDDVNICELLRLYLEKEGWEVLVAYNGVKAMELFKTQNPDFVILDIMLPGDDGFTVLKTIRTVSNVPVIMLTAKGDTGDKVTGLETGADDYICKPFNPKELVARIKAVSRRTETVVNDGGIISYENLKIDILNYQLFVSDKEIDAPPKEIELLYCLASNPNKVFTRDQLLNKVWGFEFYGDTRTVDVHIKRIRSKIDGVSQSWELKTVWGVGYKFELLVS